MMVLMPGLIAAAGIPRSHALQDSKRLVNRALHTAAKEVHEIPS
jgi:hypothetical protein